MIDGKVKTMSDYIVFDIGGTFVKYAVMNNAAETREAGKFETPLSREEVVNQIAKVTESVKDKYELSGIALSINEVVDVNTGIVGVFSPIPKNRRFSITDVLKERTGLEVSVGNDGNCAALAEGWIGAAKDSDYFISIVIGTGIGGSIVINKKVIGGANLHCGEFGFMLAESEPERPDETLDFIWSRMASTRALVSSVEKAKGLETGTLSGEELFQMFEEADEVVAKCLTIWYRRIAIGVFNLQYTIDPEKILIGGGISQRQEVIDGINAELRKLKNKHALLDVEVEPCQFANDSNLIGALFHFLQSKK